MQAVEGRRNHGSSKERSWLQQGLFVQMIKPLAFAVALSLASCATVPTGRAIDPIVVQLGGAARLILVGEIHGTAEVPAEFGRIAEAASRAWGRVNIGLELPQAAIDDADCDHPEPRSDSYWRRPNQDGRTSKAMRALVCSLKPLDDRHRIHLIAIVPAAADSSRPHPYYAAITQAVRDKSSRTLVLLGNFHTRRSPGALAQILALDGIALTTLTVSSGTAIAWNCRGRGECGPAPIGAKFCDVSTSGVQLVMDKPTEASPPYWDGCLAFPALSPSPPA